MKPAKSKPPHGNILTNRELLILPLHCERKDNDHPGDEDAGPRVCGRGQDDDVIYYDFDPKATEDQDGDVAIITFSDGSKWYNDAATGETWTC